MITWPYLILLLTLTTLSMDKGMVCHDWQSMYWVYQLPSLHHPLLGAWFTRISSCQCSKNPWKITHPMKAQVLILLDATLPVGSGQMVTSYLLMKAVSMMRTRRKMFLRLQLSFLYNTQWEWRCFSGCNWVFLYNTRREGICFSGCNWVFREIPHISLLWWTEDWLLPQSKGKSTHGCWAMQGQMSVQPALLQRRFCS